MARQVHKLSALKVKNLSIEGWYPDGQGLYLQVSPTLTKNWVYRYKIEGRERRHGLGSYPLATLEAARKSAKFCSQLRASGHDPIDYKKQLESENQLKKAKNITFKKCAVAYIESHKSGWKNAKHESQWTNTLLTYAYPVIGELSIQDIDTGLVMKVLEPIWYTKTETATRVRQRIESVLNWAKVRGYRLGENPALWRGHLDQLLPKRNKVQKVKHHPAMAYKDLPDYFRSLRMSNTVGANALAFTILTTARTSEAIQARWSEIDFITKTWIIPEVRMKMEKEHRVPLSHECLVILKEMKKIKMNDYIFSGVKQDRPISNMTLLKLLKQTHSELTVHGFRSTFRDWCAEMTNFPSDLAESALAHAIGNQVQAAYERGDKFDKRRKLMTSWSAYCKDGKNMPKVVPINSKGCNNK